jgi:HAD superfamily hydrolase (TIGR01509 family)
MVEKKDLMLECIIFDLSEVLIHGLVGIEDIISREQQLPIHTILPSFGGEFLENLCLGNITEDEYLLNIIKEQNWNFKVSYLKKIIRNNFHNKIDGSEEILMTLSKRFRIILLTDHAREWISYIETIHPFLQFFEKKYYSFELKSLKTDPETYRTIFKKIPISFEKCLFIDDNIKNITTARSSGIKSILFENSNHLKNILINHYNFDFLY